MYSTSANLKYVIQLHDRCGTPGQGAAVSSLYPGKTKITSWTTLAPCMQDYV